MAMKFSKSKNKYYIATISNNHWLYGQTFSKGIMKSGKELGLLEERGFMISNVKECDIHGNVR